MQSVRSRSRLHRFLSVGHRWLGLTVAGALLVQATTGLTLVYRMEAGRFLQPQAMRSTPTDEGAASLPQIVNLLKRERPDAEISKIRLPDGDDGVYFVVLREGGSRRPAYLSIDPYSRAILREGGLSDFLMELSFSIHNNLTVGRAGKYVVGAIGLCLILMLASGLYLWWPRRTRWTSGLKYRRVPSARGKFFQLHKLIGAYASLMLLSLALTGALMCYRSILQPLLVGSAQTSVPPAELSQGVTPRLQKPSLETMLATSRARFPAQRVWEFRIQGEEREIYRFLLVEDERSEHRFDEIRFDSRDGEILNELRLDELSAAETFFSYLLSIHSGTILGSFGRALAFATGLLLLALIVTGVAVWLLTRKKRPERKPSQPTQKVRAARRRFRRLCE